MNSEANPKEVDPNSTTVGELRKQHDANFAPGYGDSDTIGQVLGRAGVSTLEGYLIYHRRL